MCADASAVRQEDERPKAFFGPTTDVTRLSAQTIETLTAMNNQFNTSDLGHKAFCDRYPGFPAIVTDASAHQLLGIAMLFSSHSWQDMFGAGNAPFVVAMHRACIDNDAGFMQTMRAVCAKAYHRCGTFFAWNMGRKEFCELSILRPEDRGAPVSKALIGSESDQPVFRDARVDAGMLKAHAIIVAPGHIPHNFAEIESWAPISGVEHGLEVGTRVYHAHGKGAVQIVAGGGVKILCEMSVDICTAPMRCKT
jgi:hypothetical protein